ncbi:ribonuclease J [candidate division WWE3 bacterium CG08_land_8_20_14_0_20_43_13]|uniref:Ribonuclease J n=1 Tax=candidate division WWE3 bacterium CG08_land_8_20_14_0_20_43_13 TaxID=1975087 RepID=A0A2H0XA47_UNCKA|nr:MAG: ribonuclease J [candidate division WWE3 bacterium CG08_land_8_20_14_0_20_43_13]
MKFSHSRGAYHSRSGNSNGSFVRFLPLGGMGNVTRNLYVYEYIDSKNPSASGAIVVDCGIGFPEEDMLGVDLVLPDISYLLENRVKVWGVLITHGHMDHIGAIPFLVPQLKAPVFATRLTCGFIKEELEDRDVKNCQVNEITYGQVLNLGSFEASFLRLSHSVPDAAGIVIKSPAGTFFHTGDFKFDWTPVMPGQTPQVSRLAQLGDQGVRMLVSDCLRIENPGYTLPERAISETFEQAMRQAKGRVLITTFSSNISRIQQALDSSKKFGRKVGFLGRSMESYTQVASKLGYLDLKKKDIVEPEALNSLRPNQQTLLVAGSQGQRFSALARIVRGEHRLVQIKKTDTVIFSSDSIPGNEASVNAVIDELVLSGARVIYFETTSPLHVSGHASREELKLMIALTRPECVVPISGSFRHMELMADLAQEMGVASQKTFVLKNGESLEITDSQITRGPLYGFKDVLMDGAVIGEVGKLILEDRKILSDDGLIVVVVLLSNASKSVKLVDIVTRGFVYEEGDKSKSLRDGLRAAINRSLEDTKADWGNYQKVDRILANSLSNHVFKKTNLRPMILPVVVRD